MPTVTHIGDDRLEGYARQDELGPAELADILEHLHGCSACQDRFAEFQEFIEFMRSAASETQGHLVRRHETADGTLFLVVTGSDATRWEARAIGAGQVWLRTFAWGPRGKQWLEQCFAVSYPDHACGPACSDWR